MKRSMTHQPDPPVWKRGGTWLGLSSTVAILCLAAVSKTESSPGYVESNAPTLDGSWLVTVTPDIPGVPSFPSLVSYAGGGVVMVSDPSVYPAYPMTTAYHGAWARKGDREFAFSFVGFQYDNVDDGFPDGLWKFTNKEKVTIDPGGDAYSGSGNLAWEGPDGTTVSFTVTTHGTRIKPE